MNRRKFIVTAGLMAPAALYGMDRRRLVIPVLSQPGRQASGITSVDQISGLTVWLDADYGSLTSLAPDVEASNSQTVTRWLNKASSNHFNQSTTAQIHTSADINGHSANGADSTARAMISGAVTSSHQFTAFVVYKLLSTGAKFLVAKYNTSIAGREWAYRITDANTVTVSTSGDGAAAGHINFSGALNTTDYRIDCVSKLGCKVRLWRNGASINPVSGYGFLRLANTSTPIGVMGYGTIASNVPSPNARVAEVIVYNRQLTDSERLFVGNYLAVKYAITSSAYPALSSRQVVFEGDSITVSGTAGSQYPDVTINTLGRAANDYANLGASGQSLSTILTNAPTAVIPYLNAGDVVCLFAGTNDIKLGATNSAVYDNTVSYCALARATGAKVVVFTIMKRTDYDPTMEGYRAAFNSALRSGWNGFADGLADTGNETTHPELDFSATPANFSDGIHPTDAGCSAIAAIVAPVIAGL